MEKRNIELQEVMLRRKTKVLLDRLDAPTTNVLSINDKNGYMEFMTDEMKRTVVAATVAHNMVDLGYTPSKELMDAMIADEKVSQKLNDQIIPELVKLKGADVQYNPMYKNFPKEVMDMTDAEFYINAIIHYISVGKWMPDSKTNPRTKLDENVKLKTVDIGTDKDCIALFGNILNSNNPYSQQDVADIDVLSNSFEIEKAMPEFIVNRENLATLTKIMYDKADAKSTKVEVLYNMSNKVTTVNDALRIMNVLFGDGDATLTEKVTLKNVPRAERKALLSMIDGCRNISEDMKINQKTWVRVGRFLHPGEFAKQYPNAYKAFENMRSNALAKTIRTYNSLAEEAITSDNETKITDFAKQKPGVIARNLDRLLRESDNPMKILNIWNQTAPQVAPALLWQVHSHFKRRIDEYEQNALRIFTTKAKVSKTVVMEDTTKIIDKAYYQKVIDITEKALKEIYKDKPEMGKVYIAPEISRCKIPNGTRDASMGSVSMAKGSRLPMSSNANVVRGFIWWTNINVGKIIGAVPKMNSEKEYIDYIKTNAKENAHFTRDAIIKILKNVGVEKTQPRGYYYSVDQYQQLLDYKSYARMGGGTHDGRVSQRLIDFVKKCPEFMNMTPERINDRVDVDLSAAMMDKDLKLIDRCSYYSGKGNYYGLSGDITDGGAFDGPGVAEFIDIDLKKAKEHGVRYFVFTVNSYTNQPFSELEHMHFGFMEREKQLDGQIFEPATVQQKVKLNSPTTAATICMFDIEKQEMIWMDEVGQNLLGNAKPINNLDTQWHGTSMVCYKALHMEKPNLDDVIRVNVEARGGEIVYNKEDADLVFDLNEGITPMDLDYFSGELIPAEVAPEYLPTEEPAPNEIKPEEKPEQSNEER